MQHVVLIFTGGTIAMKIDHTKEGAIPSLTPNEIIKTLSGIDEYDNLIIHEYDRMPSPFITPKDMQKIAMISEEYLSREDVCGVVVVHGTDVLEETAYYLNCVIQSKKPVVLTGSMKNASELGYDGLTNLVSSIKVCYSEESLGKGTLVVMNDTINSAVEVNKTHTMSLDTFRSLEFGPLGIIDFEEVIYYRDISHKKVYNFDKLIDENVYIIKAYAGFDGHLIDYYVDNGAKGLVIEALGRGNVPPMMVPSIENALRRGIYIIIVSRCFSGRVLDTYAYLGGGHDLVNKGCILGGNLDGQKARILLMLGVAHKYSKEDIKRIFA